MRDVGLVRSTNLLANQSMLTGVVSFTNFNCQRSEKEWWLVTFGLWRCFIHATENYLALENLSDPVKAQSSPCKTDHFSVLSGLWWVGKYIGWSDQPNVSHLSDQRRPDEVEWELGCCWCCKWNLVLVPMPLNTFYSDPVSWPGQLGPSSKSRGAR